ncbi:MAG TPA: NAD-dependent epimerase/dehydratase family protein, partial [Rhodanobacter sp.]
MNPQDKRHRTILVTGGAGYIGSHVVLQLVEAGERVVVLDDLSTGFREAVIGAELVVGNVGARALVEQVLREHGVDTVMHFAARTIVPESVADPLRYYGNNTCATRNLLECCRDAGVAQIVFSSTAAVYGIPAGGAAREDTP